MTVRREPPNHNTLTCYVNYRCRRDECVERYNRRNQERLALKAEGAWDRFTDAAPVRRHVLSLLQAGATPNGIALAAGVSNAALRGLLPATAQRRAPRKHRMETSTAKKLLAVTTEQVTPPLVCAAGTARRIQALVAEGWPINHLGVRFSFNEKYIYLLLKRAEGAEPSEVRASTARRVAAIYPQLASLEPTRSGVSKASRAAARRFAQSRNWPPVSYWADRMDVIDDPDFEPLYGVTKRELIAQDANWVMRTTGIDKAAAAERLGVSKAYVEHAFRDHPEYALGTAA
ncbi:hypothetical protein ACH4A8_38975 [Streptomyces vietnamensis]|uniref:hypothetical protein n=1 Tax=Streptomyces vietnamensis TaxID=362257 RepID=UPI00378F5067